MKFIQSAIPDLVFIEPQIFEDERGWFIESFNEERFHRELNRLGLQLPSRFVQDNQSFSKKGVVRGLHYQLPPHGQGKLVRVVHGAIYDVAVDIRKNSPTFGQSIGIELNAENKSMFWIPEGFAHGFITLEDDTHVLYKVTNFYAIASERSVHWKDPILNIKWPIRSKPILSNKDELAPYFRDIEYL